jgi:hypothetical protein
MTWGGRWMGGRRRRGTLDGPLVCGGGGSGGVVAGSDEGALVHPSVVVLRQSSPAP